MAVPSVATTRTVTSTADSGSGSLRAVLGVAQSGDTINFSLTYPATITLTSGPLTIGTNVTISGPGATDLAISGNSALPVFYADQVTASISGLTIENAAGYPNGTDDLDGGGISNYGSTLTVINCTFSNNNSAAGTGGAIYNPNANEETGVAASTLTVINSTFSGNVASTSNGLGGAIYSAGTLTVIFAGIAPRRGLLHGHQQQRCGERGYLRHRRSSAGRISRWPAKYSGPWLR